jgi:hypothetical protein
MPECYCASISEAVVSQVIVCCDAAWAENRLGGYWSCTGSRLVGIGWPVIDGEIVPPPAEGGED